MEDIEKQFEDFTKRSFFHEIRFLPPQSIIGRISQYINDRLTPIREAVAPFVTPETLETLIHDYALVFVGGYSFEATPPQMIEALKLLKPTKAFLIDRYGLYFGLLLNYAKTLEVNRTLREILRKDNPNREIDLTSFYTQSPATMILAAEWLLTKGIITAEDFEGIPPETLTRFLTACDVMADMARYAQLYFTSKHALSATTEELHAIPYPKQFKTADDAHTFAERLAQDLNAKMAEMAAKVDAALNAIETADTLEDFKQAQAQAKTATVEAININNRLATILSRDIYSASDGTAAQIVPISKTIAHAIKTGGIDAITAFNVEKAVEGLQMLQAFERGVEQSDGRILYEISISKFADRAHGRDATQAEKIAIVEALKLLNTVFLVSWKANGKREAVAAAHLAKYEMDKKGNIIGNLRITLDPKLTRGKPNLILLSDFRRMQKQAKRQAQNHFRYQILSKAQKEENALLDAVFGYQRMRDETDGSAEELKGVAEYIRKHKAHDRKEIIKMFEEYQNAGWITYTRKENDRGEIIYKWRKSKTIKTDIAEAEAEQEHDTPDEQ